MNRRDTTVREVALPATALAEVARALEQQAGAIGSIHALHSAGYSSGVLLYDAFRRVAKESGRETREREFWIALSRFLERRGWGTLNHQSRHPGVGLLVSSDWAESDSRTEEKPSCSFSVGLLSRLLTCAADAPVAVLETSCRSVGDSTCTFAFGSAATMQELYGQLLDGGEIDGALARL